MDMLETSAKSGDNVLQAFEKLIGIVHDRALVASKNKTGIKGISGNTGGANYTVKLEEQAGAQGEAADANTCGC
jgi:hypothetical protein